VTTTAAHIEHSGETEKGASIYGMLAEFEDAHEVVSAARLTRDAGYRKIDAYSPFPVDGLSEALGHTEWSVPKIMLAGGVAGMALGIGMLVYCSAIAYPLNIGGRPLVPWPSFVPITFEMTVLISALSGIVGMFMLNGLPAPYHPLFDAPDFTRVTSDRFFLCIEGGEKGDPLYDSVKTRQFLEDLGATRVTEVEERK
jgi:hypothetical protein